MGRRLLWTLILVPVALLVGVGLVLLVLLATNPGPEQAPGWSEVAELPTPRGEVASAVGPAGLYVAGGFTRPASTSSLVSLYRPARDSWEALVRLPEPRHHAAAATLGDHLFVSGGAASTVGWSPEESFWLLREGARRWEELEPLPEGRYAHRMVRLDGRLYVVGGQGPSARVLIWRPGRGWSLGAELPGPRHHLAAVALDGEIWAVGGRDADDETLTRVDVYDPAEDHWRQGPDLPLPVSAAVEGVLDGDIHLVGGEDPAVPGGGVVDRHLVLPRGADAWRELDPPPLAVHGAAGGVIGGRLLVAGGSSRQGLLSPIAWTGYAARFDPQGRGP